MGKVVVLKQNSEEIREKVRQAGINVCQCAGFEDSCWLHFYPLVGSVHGTGYAFEGMTSEQTLAFVQHEWQEYDTLVIECKDVEDFIDKIKKSVK